MPSASVSASASRKRSAGSRWLPARTRPASVAATASDGPSPSQPPLTIWCDCRSSWRRQHDRAVSRPRQTARRRLNPDRIRLSQRRSSHPQSQTEHFFNSLLELLIAQRVYDFVPTEPEFPYVSLGPDQVVSDDADCITGFEITLQIDAWSRAV